MGYSLREVRAYVEAIQIIQSRDDARQLHLSALAAQGSAEAIQKTFKAMNRD